MKKVNTVFMVVMTVCFVIVNMIQSYRIKCLSRTQSKIIETQDVLTSVCEKQTNTDNLIMDAIEKYHH